MFTRVSLVFTRVHLCSLVFTRVPLVCAFSHDQMLPKKQEVKHNVYWVACEAVAKMKFFLTRRNVSWVHERYICLANFIFYHVLEVCKIAELYVNTKQVSVRYNKINTWIAIVLISEDKRFCCTFLRRFQASRIFNFSRTWSFNC